MTRKTVILAFLMLCCLTANSYAQLPYPGGKNVVVWEDYGPAFKYDSDHFTFIHWFDLSDPDQEYHLNRVVKIFEDSHDVFVRDLKHPLSKKMTVVIFAYSIVSLFLLITATTAVAYFQIIN